MSFGASKVRRALAREVRAARVAAGLTERQLARRLKCSSSDVLAIEEGRRRVQMEELVQIARAVGMDPVRLLRKILGQERG